MMILIGSNIEKIEADGNKIIAKDVDPEFANLLIEILNGRRFPIVPFINPRHHYDWTVYNCDSCVDGCWATGKLRWPFVCSIENSLHYTAHNTGDVAEEIASRMGYFGNEEKAKKGEVWRCAWYKQNPDPSKFVKRSENGCPEGLLS